MGCCHYYCAPMSASPISEYVDTRKAFSQATDIAGTVSLERLERLKSAVLNEHGEVSVALSFAVDGSGRKRIQGEVCAEVQVTCQRCLEPVTLQLADKIDLVLVTDYEQAKALEAEFDPWVTRDFRVNLADLIDEQLALALPIVSYHDDAVCNAEKQRLAANTKESAQASKVVPNEQTKNNPFAVLATLKQDK